MDLLFVWSRYNSSYLFIPAQDLDYVDGSTTFNFGSCVPRVCHSVRVLNDCLLEKDEEFLMFLIPPVGLESRISINGPHAPVTIGDRNSTCASRMYIPLAYSNTHSSNKHFVLWTFLSADVVVGLRETSIDVLEDVGTVQVCAELRSDCTVDFSFSIHLRTMNDSAGIHTQCTCLALDCH